MIHHSNLFTFFAAASMIAAVTTQLTPQPLQG